MANKEDSSLPTPPMVTIRNCVLLCNILSRNGDTRSTRNTASPLKLTHFPFFYIFVLCLTRSIDHTHTHADIKKKGILDPCNDKSRFTENKNKANINGQGNQRGSQPKNLFNLAHPSLELTHFNVPAA